MISFLFSSVMWNGNGPSRRYRYPLPCCFQTVAALRASSVPVVVSPILMLDTSMAMTGVSSGCGLSLIGLGLSVVCPWNVGVTSVVVLNVSSVSVS